MHHFLPLAIALLITPQTAPVPPVRAAPVVPIADRPASDAPKDLVSKAPDRLPRSRVRAPVLREGAILTGVRGFFARSLSEPGLLVFALEEGFVSNTRRKVLVMPCDPSDDVKAMLENTSRDAPALFEVTGAIYDYRGRAFLLPTLVVSLRSPAPPGMLANVAPRDLLRPEDRAGGKLPPRIDAYADLDAAALQQTPTRDVPSDRMAHEPDPTIFPTMDDGMAEELERKLESGIAASNTGTTIQAEATPFDRTLMLPAATRLQSHRAVISRDPLTGVWRARMDTGRGGEGSLQVEEISMDLLPTKTLERMEKQVREQPVGTPWLLSGEVVVSKERNYLLLHRAVPVAASRFLTP